jgi:hypothetical protein
MDREIKSRRASFIEWRKMTREVISSADRRCIV